MELDDLFSEAKKAYDQLHPTLTPSLGKYNDPDNWIRTQGIALIHKESRTLLGNFGEFLHRTEEGCRKLVREDPLIMQVRAVEEVSGDWWLPEPMVPKPEEPITQFKATIHIRLTGLQLHALACPIVVTLNDKGFMTHIRLALHTTFAQFDSRSPELVFFPAGTELRKEMSRSCKIELFEQIKIAKE